MKRKVLFSPPGSEHTHQDPEVVRRGSDEEHCGGEVQHRRNQEQRPRRLRESDKSPLFSH